MPNPDYTTSSGKVTHLHIAKYMAWLMLDDNSFFLLYNYNPSDPLYSADRINHINWLSLIQTAISNDKVLSITAPRDSSLVSSIEIIIS